MGQTGHGWLTRMVNAMTTSSMESTDQALLIIARRKESKAVRPNLQQENSTNASGTLVKPKTASPPAKARFTVTLPVAVLDRLRNAVYWTQGLTLAGLMKQAVEDSLDRLEQQHGEPFPPRIESLKGGRPRRVQSDRDRS